MILLHLFPSLVLRLSGDLQRQTITGNVPGRDGLQSPKVLFIQY